jgi:hypothetical protein
VSAEVDYEYVYSARCSDCLVFGPELVSEAEAEEWAATHDAENHGDNGSTDDDYERFKEARGN